MNITRSFVINNNVATTDKFDTLRIILITLNFIFIKISPQLMTNFLIELNLLVY